MRDEILQTLIEAVADITKTDAANITETTDLKGDLVLKSMEIAGIAQVLEDEYDCYLPYMKLMHANTVGEMADAITEIVEG